MWIQHRPVKEGNLPTEILLEDTDGCGSPLLLLTCSSSDDVIAFNTGPYFDRVKVLPFLKPTSRMRTVLLGRRRWWDYIIPGAEWLR